MLEGVKARVPELPGGTGASRGSWADPMNGPAVEALEEVVRNPKGTCEKGGE